MVRAALGKFIVPADLFFAEAPLQAGINFFDNLTVNSINGEQTPYHTLDNPYPNGLESPPHRNPDYQQLLLGGASQANLARQPNGATYQWNVAIQHQFPLGVAVTTAYSGLHGIDLPLSNGAFPLNSLPDIVIAKAAADPNCSTGNFSNCFLLKQVTNPFYPHITQGVLSAPTVTQNQLLRPFPQYGTIGSYSGRYMGYSYYNALEVSLQKRWSNGGMVMGAYTFSKLMSNAETMTTWLESTGSSAFQDYNNPNGEYSLSSFDSRQRLVISYIYQIPVGKGERFVNKMPGLANAFLGGWGLEGITTFQDGYPLGLSVADNILSSNAFQGNERPNVVPGCGKKIGGSMYNRLGGADSRNIYFNTACFTVPTPFTYGDESRNDNTLRGPGQADWDMALFKNIPVHENMTLDFRVEAFNLFNRVQFGNPDTTIGSSTAGFISSQLNNPRLLQLSGRFSF